MAASTLNHPNILTVHEFGESDRIHYIMTEHVEGRLLRELIGKLSPEQAIDYAQQIGKALAAAHKAGIIHRDIKSENVIVRPDGYVKVVDLAWLKLHPGRDCQHSAKANAGHTYGARDAGRHS